jgi:hypothetical protein
MPDALSALHSFDIAQSDITVWVFKKSGGAGAAAPIFTGRWIATDAKLDARLKGAADTIRGGIAETHVYDLLGQTNEGSALSLGTDETYAPLAIVRMADPTPARRAVELKDVNNADFYVVKFVRDGQSLFAFAKADSSWRSMKSVSVTTLLFEDAVLTLDERPRFTISDRFDFVVIENDLLVLNKANFESVLNYKQAHVEDFSALQGEPEFVGVFDDMTALIGFVGTNKIQLRRTSAIRTKGHYKDPEFMSRLRAEALSLGFKFSFDAAGRIIPTPDNCRDIIQALLDHRLDSRLSKQMYDVEATEVVTL